MSFKQAIVIIAAAGRGDRLAKNTNDTPKQFSSLDGIPLFIWSLTTFMQHPKIKEAILAVPGQWLDKTHHMVIRHLPEYAKQITIIPGGSSRQESVYLGLEAIASQHQPPSYVLIHDAARPFITSSNINEIMAMLEKGFACTLAIPLSDSVREIKDTAIVKELDRSSLALMQTPQAAEFKLMLEAHRAAKKNHHLTTDDAAVIQGHGIDTRIIPGSRLNIKITHPDDILIAEALINTHAWLPGQTANLIVGADCIRPPV